MHFTVISQSNTVTYVPKHKATAPKNTPKTYKYKVHLEKDSDDDYDEDDENVIHLGTVEDVTHMYNRKDEL